MDSSTAPRLTMSQYSQFMVEDEVIQFYRHPQPAMFYLKRDDHTAYVTEALKRLDPYKVQGPWNCFWNLHSLTLLGESIPCHLKENVIDFLSRCEDPNGGYSGGPGQQPHLATTYAAVMSLVILGNQESLSLINKDSLYTFLLRMKDESGCFRMHDGGEMDVRACYTAISVASILNILDDQLVENVGNFILSLQTYEGGIAGVPGSEAHGAYTYCGLATMILIGEVHRLDLTGLIDWVVFRQGRELGFQGRVNKLVDGCYSFWVGATSALIQTLDSSIDGHVFHSMWLQQYILLCCQEEEKGGLRDKPGVIQDAYHTCYCLSGLSVSQYSWSNGVDSPPFPRALLGPCSNLLEPIHPLYNIVLPRYYEARKFFSSS